MRPDAVKRLSGRSPSPPAGVHVDLRPLSAEFDEARAIRRDRRALLLAGLLVLALVVTAAYLLPQRALAPLDAALRAGISQRAAP